MLSTYCVHWWTTLRQNVFHEITYLLLNLEAQVLRLDSKLLQGPQALQVFPKLRVHRQGATLSVQLSHMALEVPNIARG